MSSQACPHCQQSHEVGRLPRGQQRLLCTCGTAFEVQREPTPPRNVLRAAAPLSTVHDRHTVVPQGSSAPAPRAATPVPATGAAVAAMHAVDGASFDGTFVPGTSPAIPGYQLLQVKGKGKGVPTFRIRSAEPTQARKA